MQGIMFILDIQLHFLKKGIKVLTKLRISA